MNKNDKAYGLDGAERLEASVRDVVNGVIDEHRYPNETWETAAKRIHWPIEVREHKRMVPYQTAQSIADHAMMAALEDLDEEYGDPDADATKPTDAIKAAALAFGEAVLADYVPWMCEPTGNVIKVSQEDAWKMYTKEETQ